MKKINLIADSFPWNVPVDDATPDNQTTKTCNYNKDYAVDLNDPEKMKEFNNTPGIYAILIREDVIEKESKLSYQLKCVKRY